MAVNLLAALGDRYGADTLAAARRTAEARGYRLVLAGDPDERLCAWIDWRFAPSWWSSEVRASSAWYALGRDGTIAGFAAFGSRDRSPHWLRAYADRPEIALFGPYGVAVEHRGTGLGDALLTAALCTLAESSPAALIPAVGDERLAALYERRARAHVVDRYDYALPRARTVILASGSGTNAQAVLDARAAGRIALEVAAIVTNDPAAPVRERARAAGIAAVVERWHRATESRADYDARLIESIERFQPELILLLGWMHVLAPPFLARFSQTLNLHPAFLPLDPERDEVVMPDGSTIPAFRGARAPEATIAAGVPWAGASVHHVRAQTDRGPILVRTPLALEPSTTLDDLRARIRPLEHAAVVAAVRRWGFER